MHEYLLESEVVRLAIVLGVLVTALFYERLHLTTGGAIVPGYLALFLETPLFIVTTLVIAVITYYLVNHVITRRIILYGRLKFEVEIITGLVIVAIFSLVAFNLQRFHPLLVALYGIGFVIPGVLAHDMARQRAAKTLVVLLINTGIVAVVIYLVDALVQLMPGYEPAMAAPFSASSMTYPVDLLLFGVIVSVGVGTLLYKKWDLRTGGFVTGAYLALVLFQPLDILFTLVVAAATYLFVTRVLMLRLMLFGRRKFSMMIWTGAVFAWTAELLVLNGTGGAYHPWSGFHVITLVIPGLLANDAERQGFPRTVVGSAATTFAVVLVMSVTAYLT